MDGSVGVRQTGHRPAAPGPSQQAAHANDLISAIGNVACAESSRWAIARSTSRHAWACRRCKKELEGRSFTLWEAPNACSARSSRTEQSAGAPTARTNNAGTCCCRPSTMKVRPLTRMGTPIGWAAVGLTDEVMERVFSSSGQAKPEHDADLKIAAAWVEGGRRFPAEAPLVLVLILEPHRTSR